MHKIAVVYYAFARGDWVHRTKRAFDRMIVSGVYDAAHEIYLIVSDPDDNKQDTIDMLSKTYSKCIVERYTTNVGSEHNAIIRVEEIGNRVGQEYKILYMHTKGAVNKYKTIQNIQEQYSVKVKGVNTWVDMMEYFLVDKWSECVSKLDDVDTVGVKNYAGWWWGNFWWTTSEHIKRLRKPYATGTRWDCEAWLHDWHPNKEEIKYYEWYQFQFSPYYTELPRYLWDDSSKETISVTIRRAEFGCFGEQQDEGRPLPTDEVVVDVTDEVLKTFDGKKVNVWNVFNTVPGKVCDNPVVRVYYHTSVEPAVERVATSIEGLFQYITLIRED